MKITFLGSGTSQGIPVIGSKHPVCLSKDPRDTRLRASIWVTDNNSSFVIDCGPDFRYQMLRAQTEFLDAILVTHEHADHVAGLDDIRPFCYKNGALPIYANSRTIQDLKNRFSYIFEKENKYPGAPSVNEIIVSTNLFSIKELQIQPIKIWHGNIDILGYRFNDVAYLTDVKTIDDEWKLKLKNLNVLILNTIRHETHHSHLNLSEALDLIAELKPKKTYLTHISHLLGFHEEMEKKLPKNVYLAYDTLSLNI